MGGGGEPSGGGDGRCLKVPKHEIFDGGFLA
jgi:hypothetical protein